MNISDIQLLYDYNCWANQLILTAAEELSPVRLVEPVAFSWGSLQGTLIHTLDAENMWRIVCHHNTIVKPRLTQTEPFPTLDSIAAYWKKEEAEMRAYLDSLHDSDMDTIVRYEMDGKLRERVLWHCLVHMVNHGTQHRSECATMLTNFGQSPGGIDLTLFLNQRI